ncbi:group-specific protein [Microaerobacter geothermalis]|uniref:group-specific protein n=1 Tax=Microaerobacter geothermalis TaxID=674972 RepID=UPI001F4494BA|nr:group-specific protein [Microaerobacter geothermalis]MCF6095221.1 group-specific protein [Microaerobacter geothermalis]
MEKEKTVCNIDHSKEDVIKKLEGNQILSSETKRELIQLVETHPLSQEQLNEAFHMAKKMNKYVELFKELFA